MPISRRDINPGDYVLYRHQNSGKILVTRMEGGRAEREVGEYLGYRSMEDAAAAARADARRRHAQRYQIYFENIGGLHVFTRNARQMDDERGYPMDLHGHVTGDTDAMAAQKYHNFLMKHYGVDSRTASKLTPAVLAKVDAWRERNGLPSPSSPLVRGYINDLVGSRPRGPMRNPPSAPRPPRPGRRVARKRGAQPAAVLPRLRRMIDDSE